MVGRLRPIQERGSASCASTWRIPWGSIDRVDSPDFPGAGPAGSCDRRARDGTAGRGGGLGPSPGHRRRQRRPDAKERLGLRQERRAFHRVTPRATRDHSRRSSGRSERGLRRGLLITARLRAQHDKAAMPQQPGPRAGRRPEPKKKSPRAGPTIAAPVSCAIIEPPQRFRPSRRWGTRPRATTADRNANGTVDRQAPPGNQRDARLRRSGLRRARARRPDERRCRSCFPA